MFNLSDLFDKYKKTPSPKEGPVPGDEINISSVVSRKFEEKTESANPPLYETAIGFVKKLYGSSASGLPQGISDLMRSSEDITGFLLKEDTGLLKICSSDYPRPQEYFYHHVVNVCILCVKISSGLGFDQPRMTELGFSALLHDIGLYSCLDIINKPGVLNKEEWGRIKQHPQAGFTILSKIEPKLSESVLVAITQEHERINGSGYPGALTENAISLNAQILGLADCFEALIHTRPYRERHSSLEASKIIAGARGTFSNKVIKALFERVGIFPVGSQVCLNTKELGVVLKTNPEFPLRPVVKILFDTEGNALKEPKSTDLSHNKVLFISGCA